MENRINDCTILVNSCDKYEDVWYPFFKVLTDNWNCEGYPIILNTESKKYEFEGLNIQTMNVLPGKNCDIEWGERLIDVLKRIHTEYVLFMLDDYLVQDRVKSEIIEKCLSWMRNDKEIVNFCLVPSGFYAEKDYINYSDNCYPGFGLREKKDSRLIAGPGIWRTKDLINLTRKFESPWIWESYGSMRARRYRGKFYCCRLDSPLAFSYDYLRGGAIHRGLWVGCYVRPILEKHAIELDLSTRGVDEDWLEHPPVYRKFDLLRIIKNRSKMIRSIIGWL